MIIVFLTNAVFPVANFLIQLFLQVSYKSLKLHSQN